MIDRALFVARLGGALRRHGVGASLRDELDGAAALGLVDQGDRDEVHAALRIALRIPRPAFAVFDRLFAAAWNGAPEPPAEPAAAREPPRAMGGKAPRWDASNRSFTSEGARSAEGETPGYSPEALLRKKPFDELSGSDQELRRMERLLSRLARRLATQRSRRLVPTSGRGRPDLRASFRRSLRTSAEIMRFSRRARAVTTPRLVVICDTSGSMQAQSRFLLLFALALRRALPRVEIFVFNTELVHVTPLLRPSKVELTLEALRAGVADWSGGTRIGECLASFVERYGRLLDARTKVVILSDGLDRGDPAALAEAVRRIRLRAKELVWLSPLLGDPRYEPTTRGLRAALPHVDHFAAAHDLESLERALLHLTS